MDVSNNIILNQIYKKEDGFIIKEISPSISGVPPFFLYWDSSLNIQWKSFESPQIWENNKLKGSEIFYEEGRIGLGRSPLLTYYVDIAVPENKLMTAFHIGDGRAGFSMGNGTNNGFLPEIIGMGRDEKYAGLYLLGRAGNNQASKVPLIIIDGRNIDDGKVFNRPILGITSAEYNKYLVLVNYKGDLSVSGEIKAEDIILKGLSINALIEVIKDLQKEIEEIKKGAKSIAP